MEITINHAIPHALVKLIFFGNFLRPKLIKITISYSMYINRMSFDMAGNDTIMRVDL